MVPVERPKTNEKFASLEKILKWKTGFKGLIPRALFLGEMRNISPVSFEL
jgi:hypothetical protein